LGRQSILTGAYDEAVYGSSEFHALLSLRAPRTVRLFLVILIGMATTVGLVRGILHYTVIIDQYDNPLRVAFEEAGVGDVGSGVSH
jgi:uncharacterized membrane protein